MLNSFLKAFSALALALIAAASSANAAVTVYTSEASFLAALQPGYYLEDFGNYIPVYGQVPNPQSFSGGPGYNYDITSSSGYLFSLPAGAGSISTGLAGDELKVGNFTGNSVTAIGGYFFPTDDPGAFTPRSVSLTLQNSGATQVVNQPGPGFNFLGFIADAPIASLSVYSGNPNAGEFPTIDHLYVGSGAVPEPASVAVWSLLGLTVGGVGWRRRKQAS